jgi:hypothetical protein
VRRDVRQHVQTADTGMITILPPPSPPFEAHAHMYVPYETRRRRRRLSVHTCFSTPWTPHLIFVPHRSRSPLPQRFFTDDFGLPLTMNPNFEDLSCEMIFGQAPPENLKNDPVYDKPCFASQCSIGEPGPDPCPKIDTDRKRSQA